MDETTVTKSSEIKAENELSNSASEYLAKGKRNLLVNDIVAAVNSLQEACRLLSKVYGETASECFDAYFYYGKALLELSRIESGVLGNALDGVPDGEDENTSTTEDPEKMTEEESEMVTEKVAEALEENFLENEKRLGSEQKKDGTHEDIGNGMEVVKEANNIEPEVANNNSKKPDKVNDCAEKIRTTSISEENGDVKTSKSENAAKSENGDVKVSENGGSGETNMEVSPGKKTNVDVSQDEDADMEDEEQDNEDGEEQDKEDAEEESEKTLEEGDKTTDSEDVDNLQLSWEMLELSKVIALRQLESGDNKELSLKLAQVYLKLGEVGLETENYAQSILDFEQCLSLQEKHLLPDDRNIAETFYHLGVTHSLNNEYKKSAENFKLSVSVLVKRVENLKNVSSKSRLFCSLETTKKEEDEIEEIRKLLPEIKEKIIDMEQMEIEVQEKYKKVKEALCGSANETDTPAIPVAFAAANESLHENDEEKTNVITHLVRKKRKPEADETPVIEIKKPRKDDEGREKPETKDEAQVIETKKLETNDEAQIMETEEPETNGDAQVMETKDEAQVIETKKPEANDEAQVIETRKPETNGEVQVIETKKPETSGDAQVMETNKSETNDKAKVIETKKPETNDEAQIMETEEPETNGDAQVMETKNSEANNVAQGIETKDETHVIETKKPETNDKALNIETKKPETNDKAQDTETKNEAQSIETNKPETNDKAQDTETKKPETNDKCQDTETKKPETNDKGQDTETNDKCQDTETKKPETNNEAQETETNDKCQDTETKKPETNDKGQDTETKKPETNNEAQETETNDKCQDTETKKPETNDKGQHTETNNEIVTNDSEMVLV